MSQGEPVAVVESVKSVSDVYAPVSGEVIDVNKTLEETPELINQDAFGEGWIAKMRLADAGELKDRCLARLIMMKLMKEEKH
ncbi:MAG: hypothetical protein MZU91_09945 [Desulfosudis oleivorans]|nr:hypothetical protein [Desulfosudis oleivorans]